MVNSHEIDMTLYKYKIAITQVECLSDTVSRRAPIIASTIPWVTFFPFTHQTLTIFGTLFGSILTNPFLLEQFYVLLSSYKNTFLFMVCSGDINGIPNRTTLPFIEWVSWPWEEHQWTSFLLGFECKTMFSYDPLVNHYENHETNRNLS